MTTGEGSGETKAAVGNSNTAALAYFPANRSRRRRRHASPAGSARSAALVRPDDWADTAVAHQRHRRLSGGHAPHAHGDGTRDLVLVVDTPLSTAAPCGLRAG